MLPDLKSFGLTVALGFGVAAVCALAFQMTWPRLGARFWAYIRGAEGGDNKVLSVVFISVVFLAIGIVAENVSKNALAVRDPSLFGPQMQTLVPSESFQRASALFRVVGTEPGAAAANMSGCDGRYFRAGYIEQGRHQFELTTLGAHLLNAPGAGSTMQNGKTVPEVIEALRTAGVTSAQGMLDRNAWKVGWRADKSCKEIRELVAPAYYEAKNVVYREDNYFQELNDIYVRVAFERSLIATLIFGCYLVMALYLLFNSISLFREIGGVKTLVGVIVAASLILSMMDVIAFRPIPRMLCLANERCEISTNILRAYLLPALFVFVGVYRARRVAIRAICRIRARESNIAGSALVRSAPERHYLRCVIAVAVMMLLLATIRLAYQAEQYFYLERVYGYYATLLSHPAGK